MDGLLLSWFKSSLDGRVQRVALEGNFSNYKTVKAAVPQGSIIGPLLFLIFINHIVEEIGSNINKIHKWSNQWLVKFNANKTEKLIISRKRVSQAHLPIIMNNTQIQASFPQTSGTYN